MRTGRRAIRWVIVGLVVLAVVALASWTAPRLRTAESAIRSVETKISGLISGTDAEKQAIANGIKDLQNLLANYLPGTFSGTKPQATAPPDPQAQAIARRVRPSVVDITAVISGNIIVRNESLGTGVVYTSDGLIITNDHVITGEGRGLAKSISVTLDSGARLSATIVGRDPAHDLAVLRVHATGLQPVRFDTGASHVKPGALVVALGNDQVVSQPVLSGKVIGLMSGVRLGDGSTTGQVLATSVPLAPGDSGGPLVDAAGRVVGIDFAEIEGERAGLALPASLVLRAARSISGR